MPKAKALSDDLRWVLAHMYYVRHLTVKEISAQTGINERTVQRLLKIVSQSGNVTTGVERKKRDPKLTDENQQFIAACLEHSPDVYLTELKAQLEEAYGVSVSPSTI
ncbi:hypothetical protein B0H21DRAFT_735335 [Amylocystis lapponica]|nr:hypothetical protein B0H21DRAFT_735335 [Amylocystis lapponica]